MTELPIGWSRATVEEIAVDGGVTDGPFGSNLKTEHYTDSGPRVVRLQNIGDGVFRDEKAYISAEHFDHLMKHSVQPGDVLVASLGELLPRACVAPESLGPAIVKADCVRVRSGAAVVPSLLMWVLNAPQTRERVGESIKGVGRPRINLRDLRALELPIPPLGEQERIVAAIEEAFSKLDAGDAELRTVRQLLKRMRDAILAAALAGRLVPQDPTDTHASKLLADLGVGLESIDTHRPMLSDGWAWARLGSLVQKGRRIAYGVLQPGPEASEGVPMVRVMDVVGGSIATDQLKRIAPDVAAKFPRTMLRGGEVLLSVVGTIGRVAVVPAHLRGANVARAVAVLPVEPAVVRSEWLAWVLRYEPSRRALEHSAHEVARKTLNLEDVRAFEVPLAPVEEQVRIVAEVDRQMSFVQACERAVDAGLERSALLRQSVLKAAFEGRLVSQEPTDEPASVLLERIRTERAAAPKTKSRRVRAKS